MSAVVGLAMVLAAILIGRAAIVGGRLQPQPWWTRDAINAYIVVPLIVTGIGAGIATLLSWLTNAEWRVFNSYDAVGVAAAVAVYVAISRLITAWARGALRAAEVVALGASQPDPRRPPNVPPLKKAA
jgi:ABC-type spermidine/putrescine transport system permease subunit II